MCQILELDQCLQLSLFTSIHAGSTALCSLTAAVGKGTLVSALADASFHPSTCWGGLVSPVWGDSPVPMPTFEEMHRALVL